GNVGSGLSDGGVTALLATLRAAARPTPSFTYTDELARNAVFVSPALVAGVRFTEATERGLLRQPVFLRLREDLRVADCDAPPSERSAFRVPRSAPDFSMPDAERATRNGERSTPRVRPSNLNKLFWPADGFTK